MREASPKRPHTVRLHLYEQSRMDRRIEAEGNVAEECGREHMGGLLMPRGVLGWQKRPKTDCAWLHAAL